MTNLKLRPTAYQIFYLNAFFFLPFDRCYMIFTYFASFTDYDYGIFEVISNWHVEGSKFSGKILEILAENLSKSWAPRSSGSLFFSKSVGQICPIVLYFFWTLSPGFENNHTFKCWSGIFAIIFTSLIMLENS